MFGLLCGRHLVSSCVIINICFHIRTRATKCRCVRRVTSTPGHSSHRGQELARLTRLRILSAIMVGVVGPPSSLWITHVMRSLGPSETCFVADAILFKRSSQSGKRSRCALFRYMLTGKKAKWPRMGVKNHGIYCPMMIANAPNHTENLEMAPWYCASSQSGAPTRIRLVDLNTTSCMD